MIVAYLTFVVRSVSATPLSLQRDPMNKSLGRLEVLVQMGNTTETLLPNGS